MTEPYIIECPYCHDEQEVHPDDEDCYADDEADEITTTCGECGKEYILTATTEVYFDAEAIEEVLK